MSEMRRKQAMSLPIEQLVAEYDRAMKERGQQADLHHAARQAMEQFRAERDVARQELKARAEKVIELGLRLEAAELEIARLREALKGASR